MSSAPNPNAASLRALSSEVLKLREDLATSKQANESSSCELQEFKADSFKKTMVLHTRVLMLEEKTKTMAEQLSLLNGTSIPRGGLGNIDVDSMDEDEKKAYLEERLSEENVNQAPVKGAVQKAFERLMDLPKLTAEALPAYPNVPRNDAVWPRDELTKEMLARFDWASGPSADANRFWIDRIVKHILLATASHQSLYDNSLPLLRTVKEHHLRERVTEKFNYCRSEYQRHQNQLARAPQVQPTESEAGGGASTSSLVINIPDTSTAKINSRRKGLKSARLRKRPLADAKYRDTKYDAAFELLNAQEYVFDSILSSADWIMRRGSWWSDELRDLFIAVDAVADPDKNRAKQLRERSYGADHECEPPQATGLATRVRSWMVDPKLLEENPEWYQSGRVCSSGPAWNEAEPSEDVVVKSTRKRRGKDVDGPNALKRARQESTAPDAAPGSSASVQEQLEKYLDGTSMDALFPTA